MRLAIGVQHGADVWPEEALEQAYLGGRNCSRRLGQSFRHEVTSLYMRRPMRAVEVERARSAWAIGGLNNFFVHNTSDWSPHWPDADSPGGYSLRRITAAGGVNTLGRYEVEHGIPLASGCFLVASDGVGEKAWAAMLRLAPVLLSSMLAPVRTDTALRRLPLMRGLATIVKRETLRVNGLYVDQLAWHRTGVSVSVGARFTGTKGGVLEVRLDLCGRHLRRSALYLEGLDGRGESDTVRLVHPKAAPVRGARRISVRCVLANHLVSGRAYALHERGDDGDHVQLLADVKARAPIYLEMLNPHFELLEAGVRFKMKLCLDEPGRCVVRNSIVLGTNALSHGTVKLDARGRTLAFKASLQQALNTERLPEYPVRLQLTGGAERNFMFRPARRGGTRQSAEFLLVVAQAMVTLLGRMQVGKSLEVHTEISIGKSFANLAKDPLMLTIAGHVKQLRKLLKNLSADGWSLANVSFRKAASTLTPRHYTAAWCFNYSDQLKAAAFVSEAFEAFLAQYSLATACWSAMLLG